MSDDKGKFVYIGNISPSCIKPSNSKYDKDGKYTFKFLSEISADRWLYAVVDESELNAMGRNFSQQDYFSDSEEARKLREKGERPTAYFIKMDADKPRKVFYRNQQQGWTSATMSPVELKKEYEKSKDLYHHPYWSGRSSIRSSSNYDDLDLNDEFDGPF